jgi:acetyltransferase-like isoleucine patch superfamily enzyme
MLNRYSLISLFKLGISYLNTKIFYRNSRLIRLPFDIRNKSNIYLGKGLTTGVGCRIEAFPALKKGIVLKLGNNIQMNDYVHITAMENVSIGNNVLLASKIYISDCVHGSYAGNENDSNPNIAPSKRQLFSKPVILEDNVWLGEFVSVLPGVKIGKGTIVGANSVVSKSLPEYVIAIGSPAKPIKKFNFQNSRWEKINML